MNDYFPSIKGQNRIKDRLGFFIDAYKLGGTVPPLLFAGEKGSGKTTIARLFAKHLDRISEEINDEKKPFSVKNCSSITNLRVFVEGVLEPVEGRSITIVFDECHVLPKSVSTALLTILGGGSESRTEYEAPDGRVFSFDLRQQIFLFATTDRQKIFSPLRDRLEPVSFGQYSAADLGDVLQFHAKDIKFSPDALTRLGTFCRGNPRSAQQMADRIVKNYCLIHKLEKYEVDDVERMIDILGFNELGLDEIELRIMCSLYRVHGMSLTALAAQTGLDKSPQQDAEKYLLKMGLMEIGEQSKRILTDKGRKYMEVYNGKARA